MPSNNTGSVLRGLAIKYPGQLGHLMSPGGWRKPFLPYALDNGAFGAYRRGLPFDETAFLRLLRQATAPTWVAVPDVVTDREGTLRAWGEWAPRLTRHKRAFVVQDGMTRGDVPTDADVVFVGGSVEWKWATVAEWASGFKRVHVGRVNQPKKLWELHAMGVESCDGTGWFRGDQKQLAGLVAFLEGTKTRGGFPMPLSLEDIIKENAEIEAAERALTAPRITIDGQARDVPGALAIINDYRGDVQALADRREKLRLAVSGGGKHGSRGARRPAAPRAPTVPVASAVEEQIGILKDAGELAAWEPKDWAEWARQGGMKPRSVAKAVKRLTTAEAEADAARAHALVPEPDEE